MITLRRIRGKRAQILDVVHRNGARDIRIFGSVARGQQGSGSDLDVLVTMEPGRSLLDLVAIKRDLEDMLGLPVHVVTEDAVSPHVRQRVLSEAEKL